MLGKTQDSVQRRPEPTPGRQTQATSRSNDLDWTLRLLRPTGLKISLFRLKLHGLAEPAASRAHDLLTARFGGAGMVQRLDDGSTLVLVIRFDDDPESTTTQLIASLGATMRERGWPYHAVAELMGVHHHAAEIGHVGDLLTELIYAPRRVIEI